MSIVAIIPARGGSKGIPRKNVKLLCGKPLIGWTIEAALAARYVDRVVVSTDDPEIASVSSRFGAEVIMRPPELSGPWASSESALLHVLQTLQETENYQPTEVVFLQCTSPLTLPEDIDGTIRALFDENADSALAVTPFHYFLWRRDKTGDAVGINHDKQSRPMRQEREPQFLETGAVYVMRTEGFKKAKHRFFGKTVLYVMPPERCLEIDDPWDLRIAEVLMRERQQQQKLQMLPYPIAALVLDFDGVLTDNRVIVFQDGQEAVVCDRGDGWGLAQLKRLGVSLLVLSAEENPVVQARCSKLGIACVQSVQDKLSLLKKWMNKLGIDPAQVIYVGNDIDDVPCLQAVGCGIAVSDACPEARSAAQFVLSNPGGRGAIRELTELIAQRMELARREQS